MLDKQKERELERLLEERRDRIECLRFIKRTIIEEATRIFLRTIGFLLAMGIAGGIYGWCLTQEAKKALAHTIEWFLK